MAIGRVNTGGGGSGATLVITGVAGDTCTITKSDKSKTKTFGSDGKATFKGLDTGTWTVTMTNSSGSTATQTVTINADYTLAISYFSATIAVTYPAGSTCTCTDGNTTLTAVGTTGSYTFIVPNAGTWTVSCTNGEKTKSQNVSITADGQSKSVTLSYEIYLYNEGDLCTAITGGWQGRGLSATSSEPNTSTPTITNNSDHMKLVFNPTGVYEAGGIVEPKLDVDLTAVKTISLTYKTSGWNETMSWLEVINRSSCQYFTSDYAASQSLTQSDNAYKTVSLNVANLSGSYDVIISSRQLWYTTSSATIFIKKIELKTE